jgi:2-oxoacid:acceptor oxidoreductase delta subunit (pyruvate/2-ketoisovalerate family)
MKKIVGPVSKGATIPTKMGNWSVFKPVINGKCTFCLLCWLSCPEAAINEVNRKVTFNNEECKGCGICAYECPTKAIKMAEPERKS